MVTAAFTLLPFVPLIAWILMVGWSPGGSDGELLLTVPVPVLARMKMLATSFVLGMSVLLIGAILGHTHWWLMFPLLVFYGLLLAIPTSYLLTTSGIRTGKGPFRRWTEFASVRRSPFGATLVGSQRASNYPIFLSGGRGDDDFVLTLKNLVRDSYRGTYLEQNRLLGNQPSGDTSTTSSINH